MFRIEGIELLIGNKKVTEGQTDRPTDMCKAGGHNNIIINCKEKNTHKIIKQYSIHTY